MSATGRNIARQAATNWWAAERQSWADAGIRFDMPTAQVDEVFDPQTRTYTHRVAAVADLVDDAGCQVTIVTVHRYTEPAP